MIDEPRIVSLHINLTLPPLTYLAVNIRAQPYELEVEVPETMSIATLGMDASLSNAVQHLWDLNANRLEQQGMDFVLNVQNNKKPFQNDDAANDPLFASFDERQFQTRPTYRSFLALLDNYVSGTGVAESISDGERCEVKDFLRAVMEKAPMQ